VERTEPGYVARGPAQGLAARAAPGLRRHKTVRLVAAGDGEDARTARAPEVSGEATLQGMQAVRDRLEQAVTRIAAGVDVTQALGEDDELGVGGGLGEVGDEDWVWGDEAGEGWRAVAARAEDEVRTRGRWHVPGGTWDKARGDGGLQATGEDVGLPAQLDSDGSVVYRSAAVDTDKSAYVVNQVPPPLIGQTLSFRAPALWTHWPRSSARSRRRAVHAQHMAPRYGHMDELVNQTGYTAARCGDSGAVPRNKPPAVSCRLHMVVTYASLI
jgi:hypothetical protein